MAWLPAGLVQFVQRLAPGSRETSAKCDKFVHRAGPATDREAARRGGRCGNVRGHAPDPARARRPARDRRARGRAPGSERPAAALRRHRREGRGERRAGARSPRRVPRPNCGPGSRPETDIQGRVPAGNPEGFTCNTSLVGHHGDSGGYKALRFNDKAGRECAYYDTTLLFPTNAQTLSERPTGVAVLDMSDPANPKQTTSLLTPAMQTPHESVLLNEKRGLLAAVTGNPAFYPGIVDVYDLNEDCRNPALQSSLPVGIFGHESRLRARRQHLLRDLDRHGQHHRGRRHQPEAADDRRGHELQLARPDDLRRRQPRLRRRQPGPVHPRHERDPGAQAGRAVQGDLQARLARAHDPAGRAADHDRRPALPGRDRRVLERGERRQHAPPTGPRSAPRGSSTSPTSATRRSSPTSASRCTSARTARCSPTTPARRASCRATRATTATSRAAPTRRSSPAR